MEFHAQALMTPELLRAAYNVVHRKTFRAFRILGLVAIGLAIAGITVVDGLLGLGAVVRFSDALPLVTVGVACLLVPPVTHRYLAGKLLPAGAEVWQYTVTAEAITEHTPQYAISYPWRTVTAVAERPEHWIVVMRPGAAVALPKTGADPAATAAVAGLLAPWLPPENVPQ